MSTITKYIFDEFSDATKFSILEKTGVFHLARNPNGWGNPNQLMSQVTAAHALVTLPDPYTLLPSGNPVIIDLSPTLPNVNGSKFDILATDLNYADKLPDGIYDITIRYAGSWGSNLITFRQKQVFFAQVNCCVENLLAQVQQDECCKNQQLWSDIRRARIYLAGIKADMMCYKLNQTVETLKELQSICRRNPCPNC